MEREDNEFYSVQFEALTRKPSGDFNRLLEKKSTNLGRVRNAPGGEVPLMRVSVSLSPERV